MRRGLEAPDPSPRGPHIPYSKFAFMARRTQSTVTEKPKPGRRDPVASGDRDASQNRAASHNYFLQEKFEAGIALRGTEVKSIRNGRANLQRRLRPGQGRRTLAHQRPHRPLRAWQHLQPRAVAHPEAAGPSHELYKLIGKTQQKGLTLIPTRLYFRNGRAKVELALAKGKQTWDKRETERRSTADKEAREASPEAESRSARCRLKP